MWKSEGLMFTGNEYLRTLVEVYPAAFEYMLITEARELIGKFYYQRSSGEVGFLDHGSD